jgi:signal transduction histidine kinase
MAQAVSNLVGNAVQYSPEDTAVTVSLRDEDGGVRLEVHNWGLPIPGERLPHIFDPFVRAQDMRSAQRNGLGLGLYITHEIVRAHSGLLGVTSTSQEGTRFWLRLPRHEVPSAVG